MIASKFKFGYSKYIEVCFKGKIINFVGNKKVCIVYAFTAYALLWLVVSRSKNEISKFIGP